jgi:hypothetical protein
MKQVQRADGLDDDDDADFLGKLHKRGAWAQSIVTVLQLAKCALT